jgi:hypothetical protein
MHRQSSGNGDGINPPRLAVLYGFLNDLPLSSNVFSDAKLVGDFIRQQSRVSTEMRYRILARAEDIHIEAIGFTLPLGDGTNTNDDFAVVGLINLDLGPAGRLGAFRTGGSNLASTEC